MRCSLFQILLRGVLRLDRNFGRLRPNRPLLRLFLSLHHQSVEGEEARAAGLNLAPGRFARGKKDGEREKAFFQHSRERY